MDSFLEPLLRFLDKDHQIRTGKKLEVTKAQVPASIPSAFSTTDHDPSSVHPRTVRRHRLSTTTAQTCRRRSGAAARALLLGSQMVRNSNSECNSNTAVQPAFSLPGPGDALLIEDVFGNVRQLRNFTRCVRRAHTTRPHARLAHEKNANLLAVACNCSFWAIWRRRRGTVFGAVSIASVASSGCR